MVRGSLNEFTGSHQTPQNAGGNSNVDGVVINLNVLLLINERVVRARVSEAKHTENLLYWLTAFLLGLRALDTAGC
jgi:hypothetical protein